MKSAIWKSTVREIKESAGRFIAILAIVALGVGFFAGLKITQPAMLLSAENYLKEGAFYDYHLLSSVGFGKEDVVHFGEQKDVAAAEGALQFDILCELDGSSSVLRAHSMTQEINKLVLTEGELPQRAEECVVDASLFDSSWIGRTIAISEDNASEDADHFAFREYTITGIVQSPLYIQYERGNTSLGNGRVRGFFYLQPEGFAEDYYTEVYVRFDQDFELYSEEYETWMKAHEADWEALTTQAAEERYHTTKADADAQIADARAQIADARQELADARAELDDAKEEIAQGEAQIADAKETLLARERELNMSEEALLLQEEELLASEAYLAAGGGLPAEAAAQLTAGKEQLANAKTMLDDAKVQLAVAKKELEEKEAQLEEAKKEYEQGERDYEDGLAKFQEESAKAEQEIADAEDALAKLEDPKGYVLGRETNIGYACFQNDSGIVDGVANVFPIFFFLVAALVCMTTMNRMVEEQRTQIGVLKALGYSRGVIMSKYIFYSGLAAALGCFIGYFGGTWLFPQVIWVAYGMMYQMDSIGYLFDVRLALISLGAAILCSVGTTWASCRYELSEVAAELMRPKTPRAGKRVLLERIPVIWRRLKFLQKVSVRNVFRYKKRFFMMILGISGCTALLVTGFGVHDSVVNIAAQQYTEIQTYDIGVTYSKSVTEEMKRELEELAESGMKQFAVVMETTIDLEVGEETKNVSLVVSNPQEDMTPYLKLQTTEREPLPYPGKNEIAVCKKLADTYGLREGDTVTLRREDGNTITATVSGIFRNFVYNYVYLSADTYEEQLGSAPEYKTAYVNLEDGADAYLIATMIMNGTDVAAANVTEDVMERFESMMQSMNLVVIVIILSAAGLAFIVLYNLTNINITERIREIATIKVLGFYERETEEYIFRENNVLSLLGALVGSLLGHFLHIFVMSQIKVDMVAFERRVEPISYFYSILLTMVFSYLIGRLMKKKIDNVSMTESLKSVD